MTTADPNPVLGPDCSQAWPACSWSSFPLPFRNTQMRPKFAPLLQSVLEVRLPRPPGPLQDYFPSAAAKEPGRTFGEGGKRVQVFYP